jgi:hypothetical protein
MRELKIESECDELKVVREQAPCNFCLESGKNCFKFPVPFNSNYGNYNYYNNVYYPIPYNAHICEDCVKQLYKAI